MYGCMILDAEIWYLDLLPEVSLWENLNDGSGAVMMRERLLLGFKSHPHPNPLPSRAREFPSSPILGED